MTEYKDPPFKERWPLLYKLWDSPVPMIGILVMFAWIGYAGLSGVIYGHVPFPFEGMNHQTLEQWTARYQNYNQSNQFVLILVSWMFTLLSGYFFVQFGFRRARRFLNRHEEAKE